MWSSLARLVLQDGLHGTHTACGALVLRPCQHFLHSLQSHCAYSTGTSASQPQSQSQQPDQPQSAKHSSDQPDNPSTSSSPATTSTSTATGMAFGTRQVTRTSRHKEMLQGVIHITNTINNIHVALTDLQGNVKIHKSAGSVGFRSARKSQPVAAEKAAEAVAEGALKLGYGSVVVKMKGVGPHKQLAAKMLHVCGLKITEVQDVTPVAYNGCRLPSRRRI